jgi:tetratricopeptide (TPR) repeat protein
VPRSDLHGCVSTLLCVVFTLGLALGQSVVPQAEQRAYEAAFNHKDVQARIKDLELFLTTFPSSSLNERALESLANAYKQSGDVRKDRETLERLLKINPDNLVGLTLKAYFMLWACDSIDCEQEQAALAEHGFRAVASAAKPDYLSDADFRRQKAEAEITFHRLAGIAVTQHDYRTAEAHCLVLVEANPNDFGYVYPLALAYLNSTPPDISRGLFFLARATTLAPAPARQQLEKYGRGQYEKYHGSADGWTNLLNMAKTNPLVPSGFTIAPARRSD